MHLSVAAASSAVRAAFDTVVAKLVFDVAHKVCGEMQHFPALLQMTIETSSLDMAQQSKTINGMFAVTQSLGEVYVSLAGFWENHAPITAQVGRP